MTPFLTFLAGYAIGVVTFAVFGKDVFKTPGKTKQVIVLDPEQGRADPRVEQRPE